MASLRLNTSKQERLSTSVEILEDAVVQLEGENQILSFKLNSAAAEMAERDFKRATSPQEAEVTISIRELTALNEQLSLFDRENKVMAHAAHTELIANAAKLTEIEDELTTSQARAEAGEHAASHLRDRT
jgi:hypothetical protein